MKVVIAAATEKEFEVAFAAQKKFEGLPLRFYTTGVGILSSAVKFTRLIFDEEPDLIIQTGIAGCFDLSIKLGEVMVVKKEILGDMGVLENKRWKDIFELKLEQSNNFPFTDKRLKNPWLQKFNLLHLPEASAITINQVSTDKKFIKQIKEKYNPAIESMEGAALHYVCLEMNVPFLQIRAVSNYVGERDKTKWKMKEAIVNLNETILKYIDALKKCER